MGKLAAALSAQANSVRGPKCSMGVVLEKLDPEDARDLRAALESDMNGSLIAKALREIGFDMKGHTVQRHRNAECGCGRSR